MKERVKEFLGKSIDEAELSLIWFGVGFAMAVVFCAMSHVL